ncbi:tail fiber domain-containing protein [Hymenobacter sp. J193]|uniref:tail fiber domain-containing protein n=1 Tax=Hymenobacter sp. J193 TaxID=2898429 RepID=UPI002151FE17|nr:tail fiber domain-containing protein [Hymenobacter sp. J193]MCR5889265.1 tail fiber domain-containing protein [Hymenobacter sp. J193]
MKKPLRYLCLLITMLGSLPATRAQTTGGVGIGTTTPAASALLDLSSTTKGLLAPRMTAGQRAAIQSPAPGLLVYQTDGVQLGFWYYSGTAWTYLNPSPAGDNLGNHTATQSLNLAGNSLVGASRLDLLAGADNAGGNDPGSIAFQYGGGGYRHWLRSRHNSLMTSGNALDFFLNNAGTATGSSAPGIGNIQVLTLQNYNGVGRVGIGTTAPTQPLEVAGNVQISGSGNGLKFPDGTTLTTAPVADNLGNHTATQNLNLGTSQLVGNGGGSGLSISNGGSVGIGTSTPNASAQLDVTATNKGFLPPRVTQAQRDAIANPAAGLVVFNTSTNRLSLFDGSYWTETIGTTQSLEGSRAWTVPAGVTSVLIDMAGAEGQARQSLNPVGSPIISPGGKGGRVQATLAVTPGTRLYLNQATSFSQASSVSYIGANGTETFLLVAGGGGQAGSIQFYQVTGAPPVQAGGAGGGLTGANGSHGAGAGSQSAGGGVGGTGHGSSTAITATAGRLRYGGTGGQTRSVNGLGTTIYNGGDGGDGYYGGGGARPLGGGGGGSSYADPTVATNVIHTQGYQTGNGYIRLTPNRPAEAPAISLTQAETGQADGAILFSDNNRLAGNPSQLIWDKANNRLGLGLNTSGSSATLAFGTSTRQMLNLWGTAYGIGVQDNTQYFRSGDGFAWYTSGSHSNTQFDAGGGTMQMMLKDGRLGIGTGFNNAALPNGPLEIRQNSPYIVLHSPNNSWASLGLDASDNYKFKIGEGAAFSGNTAGTNWLTISNANVGIGTANPIFPLDVQRTVTPGNYAYAYFAAAPNGTFSSGSTGSSTGPVSIRATGRVLATEFNATSDRRLKTVIGLSNAAQDLALLNRIRITDYTMRDRVQYGSRQFKKVIAQEVEQVFPQAVSQHSGFLPDVYALATAATLLPGDSLVQLTLPAAPATPAQAGQRVKLIGQAGDVTGTVVRASGKVLVLRGARQLAGQQVFVFGLEHADVRTVDYEALAMLNVSATQELARRVEALEKQNAALRQQAQAQLTRQQTQATAELASLAERLKALEALLGAKAEAR